MCKSTGKFTGSESFQDLKDGNIWQVLGRSGDRIQSEEQRNLPYTKSLIEFETMCSATEVWSFPESSSSVWSFHHSEKLSYILFCIGTQVLKLA